MLKHIPGSLTPDLMKLMMEMGHGEELLLADANYPALTTIRTGVRLTIPVLDIAGLLADILWFFPLDETVEDPVAVMEAARDSGAYEKYSRVLQEQGTGTRIITLDRYDFYHRAQGAAGVVITADRIKAGNILLKKGVVRVL